MKQSQDSLHAMVEHLRKVAPEVIDLSVAKTDDDFCKSFDRLLERAVVHLEKNSRNFKKLDEVGLTAVLAGYLSGMPGMNVIQEGHSNGHVDLTVEVRLASPVQRRLAEAKIDRGPVYHVRGLQQLLKRYSTGRENTGWLIVYVMKAGIKGRMEKVRKHFNKERPELQVGTCVDHAIAKWAFVSVHSHSSGERVRVAHVGCNLHNSD